MTGRMIAWLPWLLAGASLAWVEVQLWPGGGLWMLALWSAILLLYRGFLVTGTNERRTRLFIDLLFAGFCFIAVFDGGWYVLPAVAAFTVCDALGLRIRLPSLPRAARGHG